MATDVKLNKEKGYYDISWTDSGDIATCQSFDTAILMSIFEEARASASDIIESHRRRGWIGNETTPDFEQGSKTWLFEQERITGSILAELGTIVRNSLQWFIDFDSAVNVVVDQPQLKDGKVGAGITIFRDGSIIDQRYYELWNNTGNF